MLIHEFHIYRNRLFHLIPPNYPNFQNLIPNRNHPVLRICPVTAWLYILHFAHLPSFLLPSSFLFTARRKTSSKNLISPQSIDIVDGLAEEVPVGKEDDGEDIPEEKIEDILQQMRRNAKKTAGTFDSIISKYSGGDRSAVVAGAMISSRKSRLC